MIKKEVYFPNLNGLRFLAALMVMLHHFELSEHISKDTFYGRSVIAIGKLGVILFFTLSGFLLTYLLLKEKKETGTVKIRNFYVRRILRIWPLYYLVVFASLYFLNHINFLSNPALGVISDHNFFERQFFFILMLPNIAFAFGYNLPYADQAWSIGVEEQFYVFWPLLFKKMKNTFKLLTGVIIIYILIKLGCLLIKTIWPGSFTTHLYYLVYLSSFDSMAFGGLAAFFFI
jgi:peptidoglycan/LPS O-acetylase OafA/YrhL